MKNSLPELERLMLRWGQEAAEIALDLFRRSGPLRFKHDQEAITEADRRIERHLQARIGARFPDDAIFGEEFGPTQTDTPPTAGRVWHLDPIDGTLNFALGLPNFCTSMALMDDRRILACCVYSPLHAEGFTASLGEGARRNGTPMKVSARSSFGEAVVSAQLQKRGRYVQNPGLLQAILLKSMKMRRLGTIALEMAYLADGRYDAMIAGRGRPQQLYDVAAGILLVCEAGGRVTDHTGAEYRPYATDLVATNGHVHDELIALISEHDAEAR